MPTHEGARAPAPDSKGRNTTTEAVVRQNCTRRKPAAEFHDPVIGHGDLCYRVDKLWCKADPAKLPVRDCHEMVQSASGTASTSTPTSFTEKDDALHSPIPLPFGWGGINYSGCTEVRLGQMMRLGATRKAELAREAGRSEAAEGRVSDLIFLANTKLDFGMPSAKFARDWVKKNGEEKLNR